MPQTLQPLSPLAVQEAFSAGAVPVDTRPVAHFTAGFVPGSISLALDGPFAEWAGTVLPRDKALVLVTEAGREEESASQLRAEGFTQLAGYLQGGYEAWQKTGAELDLIIDVEADEFAMDLPFDENIVVLDVRRPAEFAEGHVRDAENIPLNDLTDLVYIANIEEHQNIYIHCGGGYRSVIAASLIKRQGVHNIRNIVGGWKAIKNEPRIKTEKGTAGPAEKEEPAAE